MPTLRGGEGFNSEQFKAKTHKKVAGAIKELDFKVTNIGQLVHPPLVPCFGKDKSSSRDKVAELINTVGLYTFEIQSKAPGFNPWSLYKVMISWFPNFGFEFNLYRYDAGRLQKLEELKLDERVVALKVGACTSCIPSTRKRESAWFHPSTLDEPVEVKTRFPKFVFLTLKPKP